MCWEYDSVPEITQVWVRWDRSRAVWWMWGTLGKALYNFLLILNISILTHTSVRSLQEQNCFPFIVFFQPVLLIAIIKKSAYAKGTWTRENIKGRSKTAGGIGRLLTRRLHIQIRKIYFLLHFHLRRPPNFGALCSRSVRRPLITGCALTTPRYSMWAVLFKFSKWNVYICFSSVYATWLSFSSFSSWWTPLIFGKDINYEASLQFFQPFVTSSVRSRRTWFVGW